MSELEALFSAAAPASSGAAADKLAKKTAIKQEKIHLVRLGSAYSLCYLEWPKLCDNVNSC